jgi:hypothetical protein
MHEKLLPLAGKLIGLEMNREPFPKADYDE